MDRPRPLRGGRRLAGASVQRSRRRGDLSARPRGPVHVFEGRRLARAPAEALARWCGRARGRDHGPAAGHRQDAPRESGRRGARCLVLRTAQVERRRDVPGCLGVEAPRSLRRRHRGPPWPRWVVNEATINAVPARRHVLTAADRSAARDRSRIGRRDDSDVLHPEEKDGIAVREAGRALAGPSEHADPVAKVTRSRSSRVVPPSG